MLKFSPLVSAVTFKGQKAREMLALLAHPSSRLVAKGTNK